MMVIQMNPIFASIVILLKIIHFGVLGSNLIHIQKIICKP